MNYIAIRQMTNPILNSKLPKNNIYLLIMTSLHIWVLFPPTNTYKSPNITFNQLVCFRMPQLSLESIFIIWSSLADDQAIMKFCSETSETSLIIIIHYFSLWKFRKGQKK